MKFAVDLDQQDFVSLNDELLALPLWDVIHGANVEEGGRGGDLFLLRVAHCWASFSFAFFRYRFIFSRR
jgi:hypothetical protein